MRRSFLAFQLQSLIQHGLRKEHGQPCPRGKPVRVRNRADKAVRAPLLASILLRLLLVLGLTLLPGLRIQRAAAATLSDPTVDSFNVRVGTQTFSGLYHFTTNTLLVETAQAIRDMGSDAIKLYLGANFPGRYNISLPPSINSLLTLARDEPSCHRALDMPFQHFIMWAYPFSTSDSGWANGYSSTERANDYRELYDVTCYLLTNYNNSGKSFYLGHWEGDGYLGNWTTNPNPTMIQGMIDWLNNRQKAVDDAKHNTAFTNVNVFAYAEANRVRDAMLNGTNNNERVINMVIPYVTNLDYLSYSSYDAQNLSTANLYATLDYMESKLSTNKASAIPGERIWIGEYGWGGSQTPDQQEPTTRSYIQRLLNYGRRALPFILFWEIYDNEKNADGSLRNYCLIDSNNNKLPCYYLHQRFGNAARLFAAQFKEHNGRLPTDSELVGYMSPLLDQPLPPPVNLTLSNSGSVLLTNSIAQVTGTLAQGVYGDDQATIRVFWGRNDGGQSRSAWENSQFVAVNTNFNPTSFTAVLTNLIAQTNFYFRFYATNSSGEAWAPTSAQLSTLTINPSDFGSRMKIALTGYDRRETLSSFPLLVRLSGSLPGFSYHQFASARGGDLRFTDAGGIRLIPHEIDEWNTNGVSSIWVQVPQVASSNDFVCAYWGNPLATNPLAWTTNGTTWSGHELVWHLKESGFPFADSAQQHPALSGTSPASASAEIGLGSSLNGSSQFLNAGPVDVGDAFTVSAWIKVDPSASNIQTVWANKTGGWNSDGFALYVNSYNTSDQELRLETGDGVTGVAAATATGAVSFGQWHRVAASVDRVAGSAHLYVDGVDRTVSTQAATDFQTQGLLNLGRITNNSFFFKGILDEARVEAGTRSSNWMWASWSTVASNSVLASYSMVTQQLPVLSLAIGPAGITLTWPASGVGFNLLTTTNLAPPVVWAPATNQSSLVSNRWRIVAPVEALGNRFYQLQPQ